MFRIFQVIENIENGRILKKELLRTVRLASPTRPLPRPLECIETLANIKKLNEHTGGYS